MMQTKDRLPHLVEKRLDEEVAKLFRNPLVWEVMSEEGIIFHGELDMDSTPDVVHFIQLQLWCIEKQYSLHTYPRSMNLDLVEGVAA